MGARSRTGGTGPGPETVPGGVDGPGAGRRIAVTGACGYLGGRVARALAARGWHVVGIDLVPPPRAGAPFEFRRADVRDPAVGEALAGCETVVHMAFALEQPRDLALARDINVRGSRNVLDAAARRGARAVIVASSISAYGPWPDNPRPIPETWPCRPHPRSYYARHKAEVESVCDTFEAEHPEIRVVRLRPTVVAGPNLRNFLGRAFLRPVVLGLIGEDPVLPLVHEDDLARAFALAAEREVRGAFNVGAPGAPRWREMAARAGCRVLPVPVALAGPMSDALFRLRLVEFGHDWVLLLRGGMVPGLGKAERELGFTAERTGRETWMDFLRARKPAAYRRFAARGDG
ncbi:MAG: NAD-dependent epimerase/dehydratase family protein [Acidobacteria bacterium]|nr:NAD-dependent epimerase/dehydratase family protein [Acidobacteriota bacterium]